MTTEAENAAALEKSEAKHRSDLHPEEWEIVIDTNPDPDLYIRIKKANEAIWREKR